MKINLLTKYPTIEILRILTKKELTVKDIGKEVTEISRTALYRHIKKMYEAGLIFVAKENIVNGFSQKVYTASGENTLIKRKEFKDITKEDFEQFFNRFIFSIINQFQKNAEHSNFNINFIKKILYLTPQESKEMYGKLKAVLEEYSDNKPSKERQGEEIALIQQDIE